MPNRVSNSKQRRDLAPAQIDGPNNKALEKLIVELETKLTKGSDQHEHTLKGSRTSPQKESRLCCTTEEAAIIKTGRGGQNRFIRSCAQSSFRLLNALKKEPLLVLCAVTLAFESQTRSPSLHSYNLVLPSRTRQAVHLSMLRTYSSRLREQGVHTCCFGCRP